MSRVCVCAPFAVLHVCANHFPSRYLSTTEESRWCNCRYWYVWTQFYLCWLWNAFLPWGVSMNLRAGVCAHVHVTLHKPIISSQREFPLQITRPVPISMTIVYTSEEPLTELFYSIISTFSPVYWGVCCLLWVGTCPSLQAASWPGIAWQRSEHPRYPTHTHIHPVHLPEWRCTLGTKPSTDQDIWRQQQDINILWILVILVTASWKLFVENNCVLFPSHLVKHTPVSYDVWVSNTGLLASLSSQVKLAHHPIQLQLKTHAQKAVIIMTIMSVWHVWCVRRTLSLLW